MSEAQGIGRCPERADGLGHVWAPWYEDPRKSCTFCGAPGRDNLKLGETGGFYGQATMARTNLFDTLTTPQSAFGKAPKES
jgi:hypothetical protein